MVTPPYSGARFLETRAIALPYLVEEHEPWRVIRLDHRLIALGEIHHSPELVLLYREAYLEACKQGGAVLALEYFNTEQQSLLDSWLDDEIPWSKLYESYSRGPEGFDLNIYRPLLEAAKQCGQRIVGVMPPRDRANIIARTGTKPRTIIPVDPDLWPGYRDALIPLFPRQGPMARIPVERLLVAQSFKDSVAAETVSNLILEGYKVVLVMGWAHVELRGAVVERILHTTGLGRGETLVMGARDMDFEQARRYLTVSYGNLITDYLLSMGSANSYSS